MKFFSVGHIASVGVLLGVRPLGAPAAIFTPIPEVRRLLPLLPLVPGALVLLLLVVVLLILLLLFLMLPVLLLMHV